MRASNMPKDDSAFTWFCTEMTDILKIFQIAKNQNQLMLHPGLLNYYSVPITITITITSYI